MDKLFRLRTTYSILFNLSALSSLTWSILEMRQMQNATEVSETIQDPKVSKNISAAYPFHQYCFNCSASQYLTRYCNRIRP